ncbi:Uncharacterised protein [Pseudomonas putida]|uniref:Uncharacterized protein n=2 Tax=Pseudomonas TaxID=286 RepID=A0ABM7EEW2_PSEPU|nr:hypothetical protein PP4_23450 [Pseudomonas putida NBRC 14164]SUD71013.1 Uncharacterised protein [Pseudomonas putida]
MAGFADLFSAENVGNLMQDPRLALGLQLMAQGRPGSSAQTLGQGGAQAVQMYQQQQHQRGLADYRNRLAQMQQDQLAMQQQAAQAKAQREQEYRARLADPNFLAGLSPTARMMAQLGVDPNALIRAQSADNLAQHRQAQLAQQQGQFDARQANHGSGGQPSGPRTPAPRPYIDQPIGNNQMQRYKFDPSIGDYAPWGEPFNQYSPGRKAKGGADGMVGAILNPEQPDAEAVPDASSLPGTGSMQSYMPRPQGPVGVLPMSAAGGNASQKPTTRVPNTRKPAVSGDLAAAKSAISAGKSRQAVVNRLMQAGYTAEQIKGAGI